MYKVLIADDEKNIRLGIQAMIKREFPDLETFIASDGQEALELIQEKEPHIVITDIKMPRMDGIQLIKELQQKEIQPSLLILSGYDDFTYAKEAIKHKVKDYLLKPVNRTELFKSLNLIMEELEQSQKMTYQHMDEYRASQLNYILLNPNIQEGVVEDLYKKMKIESFPEGYYVGIIEADGDVGGEDFLSKINQLLLSSSDTIPFLDKDGRVTIISADIELFTLLKEQLGRDRHLVFTIGISERESDLRDLRKTYGQAVTALKYHFLYPRRQIILYENIKEKPEVESLPADLINKISNMLGTEREKEIKENLRQVMDFDLIAHSSIDYLENLNKEINETIFKGFFKRLGEESLVTFELLNKIDNIYNFDNFHEYFHALEDLLMRIHEYHKQMKSVYSEQKYMDRAIAYIRENYHKDLNLAVVANYISLNYSYFSHMFKEYIGQNFVDYLKMVRVESAKKLLEETDFKILEISEMVGYKNPKQFARVFRDVEGISPKEYREKNG
ncbi:MULTISPECIES: response regulator [Mesobacillus]|uniref:Response regulator n=1 Tax=Mesobacillus selenatarsenatis TaxID=388741 RepID=A0A846THR2_9BACI|nr:response regulator [Mesobacillus sp. S13]NKE08023.1 response regulator [Mesobacillus selenatarsenatis]